MNHRIIVPTLAQYFFVATLLQGCATGKYSEVNKVYDDSLNRSKIAILPSGTDRIKIIACQSDLNRDGAINLSDVSILASQLGLTCFELDPDTPCADLAHDGRVNLSDIPLFSEALNGSVTPSAALCDNPSLGDTDGLSVWGEQVVKLNSNPEVSDTDGDGIDDLHELEAFTGGCKVASFDAPNNGYKTNIIWDEPLLDDLGLPVPESEITGYKVYFGNAPGVSLGSSFVATKSYTKALLARHTTYYYAISSMRRWVGHSDVEGLKSGEVCSWVP